MNTIMKKMIVLCMVGFAGMMQAEVRFFATNETDFPVEIDFNSKGLPDSCGATVDTVSQSIEQVIGAGIKDYLFLPCVVGEEVVFHVRGNKTIQPVAYKTTKGKNEYRVIIKKNGNAITVVEQ